MSVSNVTVASVGNRASTAVIRTTKRIAAAAALGVGILGLQLLQPGTAAMAAIPFPTNDLEKAACMGGGNYGTDWDFIEPYVPIIYAFNNQPGVVEYQDVAFHVRLNRWTSSGWIVDPQAGGWSAWSGYRTFDTDASARYLPGADRPPSGIRLKVPQLGHYYAVSFQAAWKDARTGAWTYGPVKWVGYHLNMVNGSQWTPDQNLGFFGCDFIPDIGYIPL